MKFLALDTSSARCSAALWQDGELLQQSTDTARDHARLILPMIDALLAGAGLGLRQLDGIAFGRGPGSFTGLRIAAAVTQGLAAGADLPVLPVSDLRALAAQARDAAPVLREGLLLGCMDARMGEIYWGVFDAQHGLRPAPGFPEVVAAPEPLPAGLRGAVVRAAGRGLAAYPGIADWLGLDAQACLSAAEPDAADIARLAAGDLASGDAAWMDATAAQPVYLRDKVAKMQS
jgi:tRNA threonylcarbamoyladenosine biosynthesis protein TsaB